MQLPPTITDLCILSSDVPRAVAFYRDRMGLPIKRLDEGFAEFGTERVVLALWDRTNLASHIGWQDATHLKGGAMLAVRLDARADIDAAYLELTGRGIVMLGAPKLYPWNAYAFYFTDPDETLWEFYFWAAPPREEPDF
jgi:uncharacterized protein